MTILFAGGDVGGVRCLMPVAQLCLAEGHDFLLLDHGAVAAEWTGDASRLVGKTAHPADLFAARSIACLVFSSSVADGYALSLAREAARRGIPTIHLLDHWSSYAARMTTDGGPLFEPTIYGLPDELARCQAIEDGVPPDRLRVLGQAALHDLPAPTPRRPPVGAPVVLFVSEPVTRDQGADDRAPLFRGYTELDAIDCFAGALLDFGAPISVRLLPHPRQTDDEVAQSWARAGRGVPATLVRAGRGRDLLPSVDGVAGMASMLLFEAWLMGLPVLSVQPSRRRPLLQVLADRRSAWLVERRDQMGPSFAQWHAAMTRLGPPAGEAEQEQMRHAAAPRKIMDAILSCRAIGALQ